MESPQVIAHKGESIYKEKFKEEYEREYPGKFVAIDVSSGEAFVADTPEEALEKAQAASVCGPLHLIKIGSEGVYKVGYTSRADWIFQ